jgi:hypothetical protein
MSGAAVRGLAHEKLHGVHLDGRRWRVIPRIDAKGKHVGYFDLLWDALICANYNIAYLGPHRPLNDIAELPKTHPVLIAEQSKRKGTSCERSLIDWLSNPKHREAS